MQIVELIIGTVLLILLVVKITAGEKYSEMVEVLEGKEYPLKEWYGIGYAWQRGHLFAMKSKMKEELMGQAKILYDMRYAEYYAEVAWVQMLTFAHVSLCAGFLMAGCFDNTLLALSGVGCAVVFGYFFLHQMKDKVNSRQQACALELPEVVSTMALLINSGMMLREAWETIAYSKEGTMYKLMQDACQDMQNGLSELDAIYRFGVLSGSPEIKKFASSLTQGVERGNSDLSVFLSNQSSELWNMKKQLVLQKGEAASAKLLLPTVLIFVGIIMLVIVAAVGTIM